MSLTIEQIREVVKSPRKSKIIGKAVAHQNRIRFHAQTRLTAQFAQPLTEFLGWVDDLIPADKARTFKTLFRFPVKTNEITNVVFDKLSRIFDGRNPASNYQFINSEQRDDWEYYRQEVLKEPAIWQTRGWEYFQTEINSVLIVDLPTEQPKDDRYPAPYFYWLPIGRVIDFETTGTASMRWIAFRQANDRIAVFDEEYYRVFRANNGQLGDLLIETKHNLGYCPARFFWSEPLNLDEPDVKRSPLSKELSALDWYLFFHISKHHLDLFGSYPVYSGYAPDCNYRNKEGDVCDGGFLRDADGSYKTTADGLLLKCPKCGDKRIAGAGSFVEIPIPDASQGVPDLKDPVKMLGADVASLNFNVQEEQRLRQEIITSIVGTDTEIINDQALNELQVDANFESQSTVLNRVKKGFEAAQNFVDETVCRLRYGNLFISANVNLGTEFYTLTPMELRRRYQAAKSSGASEAELDAMQTQIIETEYRNNPTQLQRMLILAELEPYRHLTLAEVVELWQKKVISDEDMRIKLSFADFVRRFERENINIIEFGTEVPYAKKIDIITNKFKEYADENRTRPSVA